MLQCSAKRALLAWFQILPMLVKTCHLLGMSRQLPLCFEGFRKPLHLRTIPLRLRSPFSALFEQCCRSRLCFGQILIER